MTVPSEVPELNATDTGDNKIETVELEPGKTLDSITTPPDSVGIVTVVVPSAMVSKKDSHVVEAGETLYGIAHEYDVGVMDLVDWNGLNLQEGIKPGQVIKLSESQPSDEVPARVETRKLSMK